MPIARDSAPKSFRPKWFPAPRYPLVPWYLLNQPTVLWVYFTIVDELVSNQRQPQGRLLYQLLRRMSQSVKYQDHT